jgi:hypothetical protein
MFVNWLTGVPKPGRAAALLHLPSGVLRSPAVCSRSFIIPISWLRMTHNSRIRASVVVGILSGSSHAFSSSSLKLSETAIGPRQAVPHRVMLTSSSVGGISAIVFLRVDSNNLPGFAQLGNRSFAIHTAKQSAPTAHYQSRGCGEPVKSRFFGS